MRKIFSRFIFFTLCSLLLPSSLSSLPFYPKNEEYDQWFIGPLFAPNPTTVDPNHPGLEIEALSSNTHGLYNSSGKLISIPNITAVLPYFDYQMSINKTFGFEVIGAMTINSCGKEHFTHLRDTFFRFGIQILNDIKGTRIPDFRILIQETIPTGKYDNLSFKKKGCDLTGQGSFQTGIHFAFQKLFYIKNNHFFRMRASLGYFLPAPVSISGLSYYGGNTDSRGIAFPGNYLTCFLVGEYSLTYKLAIACEFNYQRGWKGNFLRKKGDHIYIPNFNQCSLYPEIQYSFSKNFGFLIGSGFTIKGKNSPAFYSCYITFLYIFSID